MKKNTIRIYSTSGFVFDISYQWVMEHMGIEDHSKTKKIEVIEYLRRLSWFEILPAIKLIAVIEDDCADTMNTCVFDVVEDPFNYPITKKKALQLKLNS
jgi:hypothetical protein